MPEERWQANSGRPPNGGQYIFVIPELELVAVFTRGNYNSKSAQLPFRLLKRYVLPAVR